MLTLERIRKKIIGWKNDKITTSDIQQWGEEKYMSEEMDSLNEFEHFIAIEVLQYLEFINMNLTTKEDIPYVLEYIDTAKRYSEKFENLSIEDTAYIKWYKYRDDINYRKRAEELKDDPFYREYCMSILKSHTKNPNENEEQEDEKE